MSKSFRFHLAGQEVTFEVEERDVIVNVTLSGWFESMPVQVFMLDSSRRDPADIFRSGPDGLPW